MIYIVRGTAPPDVRIVMTRRSPGDASTIDFFCVDDRPDVRPLHDGWYADDHGGGVAVWGGGRYWEVRSTPFEVTLSDIDA